MRRNERRWGGVSRRRTDAATADGHGEGTIRERKLHQRPGGDNSSGHTWIADSRSIGLSVALTSRICAYVDATDSPHPAPDRGSGCPAQFHPQATSTPSTPRTTPICAPSPARFGRPTIRSRHATACRSRPRSSSTPTRTMATSPIGTRRPRLASLAIRELTGPEKLPI